MALNAIDCWLYEQLVKAKVIPENPDVLELGEACWHSDVDIQRLIQAIQVYADAGIRMELLRQLERSFSPPSKTIHFEIAKIFYKTFLNYRTIASVDFDGSEQALRYDLNVPLPLAEHYHVVINTGTAEHIFNAGQFFKTMHERTCPNGLMIHALPFTGWLDHGFFNFNPTFVADLATANEYQLLIWLYGELKPLRIVQLKNIEQVHEMSKRNELGANSLQYAVFRKPPTEKAFAVPLQGVYRRQLSQQAAQDWQDLR